VLPGDYPVRLTVAGRALTQPLRVEPDPRSTATAADLEAQLTFALEVRDRMSRIADMIVTIRGVREQLKDRRQRLGADPRTAPLVASGDQLIARLDAIERVIHNPDAEIDYDVLTGRDGGTKLYSKLAWLLGSADDHDGPPTQGMREVGAELAAELAAEEAKLEDVLTRDLARLDAIARESGVPFVVVPSSDAR
jgi:hypothetical protein